MRPKGKGADCERLAELRSFRNAGSCRETDPKYWSDEEDDPKYWSGDKLHTIKDQYLRLSF